MNDSKRMPYRVGGQDFDRMRQNILRRTAEGGKRRSRRYGLVLALSAAAAAVLGIVATRMIDNGKPEHAGSDLEQMLSTASPSTLQEVAELNYDDIFYNQQL